MSKDKTSIIIIGFLLTFSSCNLANDRPYISNKPDSIEVWDTVWAQNPAPPYEALGSVTSRLVPLSDSIIELWVYKKNETYDTLTRNELNIVDSTYKLIHY